MNELLQELYREVIVDHGRRPRNFKKLEPCTHSLEGFNPLCGDKLTVYLTVDNDQIQDVTFEGAGCAISMASASLMTEMLKGQSVEKAHEFFQAFRTLVTQDDAEIDEQQLGKLIALAGVKAYPMRVKCATLAWHTLEGALNNSDDTITTE